MIVCARLHVGVEALPIPCLELPESNALAGDARRNPLRSLHPRLPCAMPSASDTALVNMLTRKCGVGSSSLRPVQDRVALPAAGLLSQGLEHHAAELSNTFACRDSRLDEDTLQGLRNATCKTGARVLRAAGKALLGCRSVLRTGRSAGDHSAVFATTCGMSRGGRPWRGRPTRERSCHGGRRARW